MKSLLFILGTLMTLSVFAQTSNNLPDSVDANQVPASEESREGELIDTSDPIDLNDTPAQMEEREEDEVRESSHKDQTEKEEEEIFE